MTADQLMDHIDIHALFCALCNAYDEKRLDQLDGFYAEDAVLNIYMSRTDRDAGKVAFQATGRRAIRDLVESFHSSLDQTHHSLSNFTVTFDGDRAEAAGHMRAYHRGGGQAEGHDEESLATFVSKVVREGGRWRIQSFDYTILIMLGSFDAFPDAHTGI